MSEIAIKLENVSKYYKLYNEPNDRLKEALNPFGRRYHRNYYALKNIDMEIKKGEILGVVGRNGCGKSTLLKLISGVLNPSEGKIVVNGKISALLELGSGFNPEFTGLQNIFFYGSILGFTGSEMNDRLDDILAFADIGEFINQQLKTYSSGMKSRLGFAVAVHIDPDILILDEVLSVGDIFFRRKCYAKMEEYFNSGKTIIYVSHTASSINALCTRAILLHEGGILVDDIAKNVTRQYQGMQFSKSEKIDKVEGSVPVNSIPDVSKRRDNDPYYVDGLLPSHTTELTNYDVSLSDYGLYTLNGDIVNHLVIPDIYKVKLTLSSMAPCDFKHVRVGFSIKDEKGVGVGGALLGEIDLFQHGDVHELGKEIYCNFKAGVYYLTFNVQYGEGEEREIIKRVNDASMFVVLKWEDKDYWGGSYIGLYRPE
jgi:lipopolysaccharide transport system ATP-binding protein